MHSTTRILLLLLLLFVLPGSGFAQDVLPSPGGADKGLSRRDTAAPASVVRLTPSSYVTLLGRDLRDAVTKPFHMSDRDWGNAGKFALVAGALAFADLPVQRAALRWRNNSSTLRTISAHATEFGGDYEGMVLGGIGLYGYLFKKPKLQTTTLLATQSYITGCVLFATLKKLTGRQRPYGVDPNSLEVSPRFHGPFAKPPSHASGSAYSAFPSGHTTVAFAVASVFALQYRETKWVPILSYSTGVLIGLSRITENKHWATDVLGGAALGYLCGRLAVRNYQRHADRVRSGSARRSGAALRLSYAYGQVLPGVVYRFR